MRIFEEPNANIIMIEVADVITASTTGSPDEGGGNGGWRQ